MDYGRKKKESGDASNPTHYRESNFFRKPKNVAKTSQVAGAPFTAFGATIRRGFSIVPIRIPSLAVDSRYQGWTNRSVLLF